MDLGSCQYDGIVALLETIGTRPIAPGWAERLDASWNESVADDSGSLESDPDDSDDLPKRDDYAQSLSGYIQWMRDSSHDLWSAMMTVSQVLFDDLASSDDNELAAIVIATCIEHGASLEDFAGFDT